MVQETRWPSRVISLRAGPAEVDTATLSDVRSAYRATRTIGRQLAAIGDRLDRDWGKRLPNRLPAPLHMLRPVQTLTRTVFRDIQSFLWGFQGLPAAAKAQLAATTAGQELLIAEAWAAWMSNIQPLKCTGWTRGVLVTVALVATVTIFPAVWVE
ncbi:bcl-2-interacting killer isoform X2 [Lampris incognitus]|uniref:bcl-2-interacting killer isoform X2 n=1 Tax=Lampris incognitus TaxID=2546036 RepID=UPI0024B62CCB|nr:bcl-2-interacting killer isoform X2 [Lampris incognitus]